MFLVLLLIIGAALLTRAVTGGRAPAAAPLPLAAAIASGPTATAYSPGVVNASRLPGALPGTSVGTVTATPVPQTGMAASSIRIPALSVDATIGPATVVSGVLTPPRVPTEVGLWSGSAALDATTGEVTLAGHVNWAGMAPFAFGRLAYLHVGDLVYTADQDGHQTAWRVNAVTARVKTQGINPAAFAGPAGKRTLALITCGGAFDDSTASYDDNVYVMAHPA